LNRTSTAATEKQDLIFVSINCRDEPMSRERFFDTATFGALVTGAFFVRNAVVIVALVAFTLIAFAN
jgi:hypothetical protein